MTDETSTLDIEIKSDKARRDLDQLDRGLKKTTKSGDQLTKKNKELDKSTRAAGSGFKFLGAAIAAAFSVSAITQFTRTIATFEQLQNSLGVVFQDFERGKEVFKDIQELASTTPFSVEALTQSVIKLRAAGIEPTVEQLTLFSDVASVTTDTVGSLQAITDLFSRTTAGGLGLEDLNRLADRGIPVFTILQERLGLARLEVAELGKTAEGAAQILDALTQGLEDRFGGASAQAADLLSTSISNVGDAWDRFLVSLGDAGALSIATSIAQGLATTLNFLSENVDTVVVALGTLASFAIPLVIRSIRALTLAIASNPIGLIAVGVTAAIVALYTFRGVIFDTAVKAFEVWIPNAVDRANIAFKVVQRTIIEVVNVVLTQIERLANSLINNTPDWLKGWLGIDGTPIRLELDTQQFDQEITRLEKQIADRVANFKPPPRPDFLGLDEGDTGTGAGGLESGDLTGRKLALEAEAKEQAFTKDQERLARQLEQTELSLLTEEERLFESYARRQFIVEDAFEQELISEEKRQTLLLTLTEQYEKQRLAIEKKGWTERQKFAAKSSKAQTQQVLGELLNLTAGVSQHNRQLFELNKAAGIANAIINTYEGVSETLATYPQPLAGILAATHLAAGLATVDAIKNTSFQGGAGSASIPSAAAGGAPAPASDVIQPLQEDEDEGRQIIINVIGDFGSDGFRLAVVDAVETAEANDEVIIRNVAN